MLDDGELEARLRARAERRARDQQLFEENNKPFEIAEKSAPSNYQAPRERIVISSQDQKEFQQFLNKAKPNSNYESVISNDINHASSLNSFVMSPKSVPISPPILDRPEPKSLTAFLQENKRGDEFNIGSGQNSNKLDKKLQYKMELDAQNEIIRRKKELEKQKEREIKVLAFLYIH